MPAAVPAIPPNPNIAAIIAITRNVNAQLSMIKGHAFSRALNEVCPYFDETPTFPLGYPPTIKDLFEEGKLHNCHEDSIATHEDRALLSRSGKVDVLRGHRL
jgi:hypothetical protein